MERFFFIAGSFFAALGVILGAFAAHALKERLDLQMLAVFETAVRYQFIHALALFITSFGLSRYPSTLIKYAGFLFIIGILLFSGSLYALSLTSVRMLGIITPFGGLSFILGWSLLGIGALKKA